MQAGIGRSTETQERVTRGLESTPLCALIEGPRGTFLKSRTVESADLTGIPLKSIMGPVNYRPLKKLGSPGLIVEPPKHQTSIARIRVATPAQLRVVEKLLEPKDMGQ